VQSNDGVEGTKQSDELEEGNGTMEIYHVIF
jgi:hypothetical protein